MARFVARFEVIRAPRRGLVWSPAREGNSLFYVQEGLVRFYYLEEDQESDRLFAPVGRFVRPVTAAALGLPYGCQALEPSVVLVADYEDLARQFAGDPEFGRFERRLTQAMLTAKDRHLWSLQNLSAAERVQDFARRFPDLVDRVPQYHIASYLGMTSVSYSRLKGSLS